MTGRHSARRAAKHKAERRPLYPKSEIEIARAKNRKRNGPDAGEMRYRKDAR